MENFKTPKLLITDHYDSVIRLVDMFIEELLDKSNDKDILPEIKREGLCNQPYSKAYEYDMSELELHNVTPGTTRVRVYLELVRSKAIEKLKDAEQETLDRYEENKNLYKYNRDELTDEKVEEMRRNLFKDKFSFVLKIDESYRSKWMILNYTIITDFYLNDKELDFLKERFLMFGNLDEYNEELDKSEIILDEKILLLNMIQTYITGIVKMQNYGSEIISISKLNLFKTNRVETNNYVFRPGYVNLSPKSTIDLSFIKSLTLIDAFHSGESDEKELTYSIRDLSGLRNLEYLTIEDMILYTNSFKGLHKLIKLELIRCESYKHNTLDFDDLINLQTVNFECLDYPVELKCLKNLRVVKIRKIKFLKNLKSLNENVNILDIGDIIYDLRTYYLDSFFSSFVLPHLSHLSLYFMKLPCIKEIWFSGMKLLKELQLFDTNLTYLDFCHFDCFANLESLDLSYNKIYSLKEGVFSKLKRLKRLKINCNPLAFVEPNAFKELNNLEYLSMSHIWDYSKCCFKIEKDTFNGLINLKELSLYYSESKLIDSEAFNHTPNLVILDIRYNKLKLEENIFANLKYLKTIKLAQCDIKCINTDVLESLKKSNVEIIN